MSATPRSSFASAQALVETMCQVGANVGQAVTPRTLRLVQGATALFLIAFAGVEIWLGLMPQTLLLLAAATVLALAALRPQHPAEQASQPIRRDEATASEIILQLTAQQAGERAATPSLSNEAWGDLMARVSHDLRTPLNAVIGFSDVMGCELFGPVGDQRYREYITHIRDSGRELLKSAEDTLAITSLLGRKASGEALNLEDMAVDALRAAGIGDAEIDLAERIDVIGDRRGLRQVMVNLFSEARMRACKGATIRLTATCEDEFVIVQMTVGCDVQPTTPAEASLHICMARVLLELQGARLIEFPCNGQWRAVTVLGRASQQDFFAAETVPMGWRPRPQHAPRMSLAS
jgi:signal transduction histidine kinase